MLFEERVAIFYFKIDPDEWEMKENQIQRFLINVLFFDVKFPWLEHGKRSTANNCVIQ